MLACGEATLYHRLDFVKISSRLESTGFLDKTMQDFQYLAPNSLAEASKALAERDGKAKMLAGGTDLIVQLREGLRSAELVIDAKRIPELCALQVLPDKGLTIGAAVSCTQIVENPLVCQTYPALADTARLIGSWQIQNRASIGGNLCNASPAADSIPALIAYRAVCRLFGPAGWRELPVEQFCTGPGKNALQRGELLVTIQLPPPSPRSGAFYQRFIPRNEMDIAVVGVGSWVQLDGAGTAIAAARIGLGAVAPTPLLAAEAGNWLAGKPATAESFARAGELARSVARPISDMRAPAEYRTHLVGVLTQRTLAAAVERARAS